MHNEPTRWCHTPALMMAGHLAAAQPLYTIEQFELIRRLRNSGINKEQVLQAFESLERMDRELGAMYALPISIASTFPVMAAIRQTVPNQALTMACAAAAAANRVMTPQAVVNFMTPPNPVKQEHIIPKRKRSIDATNGDTPTPMDLTNGNSNVSPEEDDIESSEEFKLFVV